MTKEQKAARRDALMTQQDGKCFYCAIPVTYYPQEDHKVIPGDSATLDHVIPRSKGGSNDLENLVVACYTCNNAKADTVDGPLLQWKLGPESSSPFSRLGQLLSYTS